LTIVGGHSRVPSGEPVAERAVEDSGVGPQEPVGALLGPLHRLFLGEALVDHDMDGELNEGGRDDLAVLRLEIFPSYLPQ
jgi:hypothetical protein